MQHFFGAQWVPVPPFPSAGCSVPSSPWGGYIGAIDLGAPRFVPLLRIKVGRDLI